MEFKRYEYIKNYIRRKYPIYCKNLQGIDEAVLIGIIYSNSLIKKYDFETINSGKIDKIIDELVDNYVKDKLNNVWNDFNNFCDYIKKVILKNDASLIDRFDEKDMNDIIKEISSNIISVEDNNYTKYMDGFYDQNILNSFMSYSDQNYDKCFNYVSDILIKNNLNFGYNIVTYDYLLDYVMFELLKEKNVEEIVGGLCDNSILTKFKTCSEKMKFDVQEYVRKVLNEMMFLFGVPENKVIEYITNCVILTGKLSIVDLFGGKLDKYIEDYASVIRNNNTFLNESKKYILEKIKSSNSVSLSDEEFLEIRNYIFDVLYKDYRCNLKDISLGNYDDIILKIFNRKLMLNSSVKRDNNVVSKIKHKVKKKKIPSYLKVLLIIGLLTCSLDVGSNVINDFHYQSAYSSVVNYDNYDYARIFAYDNNEIEPVAINALNFYNKVANSLVDSDIYGYLGFYNVYTNVYQDKLYIMDEVLNYAKKEASKNYEYLDIYKSISSYECFLEFVMDRLYDMGCKEIKNKKYKDALESYILAKNNKDKEIPMNSELITEKHKKVIEEIMDMYREYNKKAIIEFSEILPNIEVSVDYNFSNGSRRNV